MVIFDSDEFEVAMVTYKRPDFILAWLDKCYLELLKRNISLSIYDSSPDDETERIIENFNQSNKNTICYHRIASEMIIGYKPMIPILRSKSEYIWVVGDSRYHNFDELDCKVFPRLKNKDVEYIVLNTGNNFRISDTLYDDKERMIHDTFVASTCIGLSIYKTSIFDVFKKDPQLLKKCDEYFRHNYGFGWLGYFYYAYAYGEYKTLLLNVYILPTLNIEKTISWATRFYGCWVDDLIGIIDNIPEIYTGKDKIPMNTWSVMKLDSINYSYLARKSGDLNRQKYLQLDSEGKIERITKHKGKIKFCATAPIWMLKILVSSHRIISQGIRMIKDIAKKMMGENLR